MSNPNHVTIFVRPGAESNQPNHMPPKISLLSNSIFPRIPSTYICLQCRFHTSTSFRRRNFNALLNSFSWPQVKHQRAASTASTTAIDARREIPPLFQDLHASLSALKDEVFINTDSSQLQLAQLALRGLESENVLTRVAGSNLRFLFKPSYEDSNNADYDCFSPWDQRTSWSSKACPGALSGSSAPRIGVGEAASR